MTEIEFWQGQCSAHIYTYESSKTTAKHHHGHVKMGQQSVPFRQNNDNNNNQ